MKKKWPIVLLVLVFAFGCKKATTSYTVFYKATSKNGNITSIRYMNTDGSFTKVDTVNNNSWASPTFSASQGNKLSIYAYCKNTTSINPEVTVYIYFSDNSCPTCGEFVQADSVRAGKVNVVRDSIVNYTLPH